MNKLTFEDLLKKGDLETLLANGGSDLTPAQIDIVKEYGQYLAKEELQKRQHDVASQPGYKESVLAPALKNVLAQVGGGSKPSSSNKSNNTSVSLVGSTSKFAESDISLTSPVKTLGEIYKLLVEIQNRKQLESEEYAATLESKENNERRKHQEILKALTVRRVNGEKPNKKVEEKPQAPKPAPGKPVEPPKPQPKPEEPKIPPKVEKPSIFGNAAKTAAKVGVVTGGGLTAVLAKSESGDYNQLVYPKVDFAKNTPSKANLTSMSIGEVLEYQKQMNNSGKYPSSAVGKYQIVRGTLIDAVNFLKKDINLKTPFDKDTQDLIYKRYLISGKRAPIENFISGKSNDIDAAQLALAQEFASFPVPYDILRPKSKDWDERLVKKGQSYYVGAAGNIASVTPEQSAKALMEERQMRLGGQPSSVPQTTGDSVNSSSVENKLLKDSLKQNEANSQVINNTNINRGVAEQPVNNEKYDDRSAYDKKKNSK